MRQHQSRLVSLDSRGSSRQHQLRLTSLNSRSSSRKAQIKMFETIGVLVVFFFILISGTVFYFNIQKSAMQKELAKQAQLKSLQAAQRAMFLPELDCSFVSVQRENCFDRFKLAAFQAVTQAQPHAKETYFGLFGYATINITQIYPPDPDFIPIIIYDNPPEEYARALKSRSPVLLYDSVAKQSAFGLMEVTTYASS